MKRIALFASGSGSNAENIINYFTLKKTAVVTKVFCNNPNAKVFDRCKRLQIDTVLFSKEDFFNSDVVLNQLKDVADYIVLAGFLLKIPSTIIDAYPNKIINIHPALLPKYGGKGMYGMHVHNAVKENKDSETGITIHFVNENYDEGAIIFQATTKLENSDSVGVIAQKIHTLEYTHFPKVIESVILQ
ncbi:Phosphoribosylglycinamide formyltransferase [Polaribacter huanghezhanensis]|uniref:phosphoribosylglycinamide formyltransferase n=1 Tax=Polaribacter huanghezhanensis TaxID=1354726 RepID=UPI002647139A|nr:phosphoribosylglycinamide formyltransferase [Polaribacter huanghezhanensis]WKD85304.1 Phosphoribosylglycinamide formyltransferase [Polaribacter huanghezhanensis]